MCAVHNNSVEFVLWMFWAPQVYFRWRSAAVRIGQTASRTVVASPNSAPERCKQAAVDEQLCFRSRPRGTPFPDADADADAVCAVAWDASIAGEVR